MHLFSHMVCALILDITDMNDSQLSFVAAHILASTRTRRNVLGMDVVCSTENFLHPKQIDDGDWCNSIIAQSSYMLAIANPNDQVFHRFYLVHTVIMQLRDQSI